MSTKKVAKGRYATGVAMIEEIVRAAERVLAEQGHAALSLRRVAEECGLKVGNLSYYFPAKHDLIKAVLESIIEGYRDSAEQIEALTQTDPEKALKTYLLRWMRDNEVVRTSRIYVEVWAMANNDPHVREAMDRFYDNGRRRIGRMIAKLNPALPEDEIAALALHVISTMEGLMVFANKSHAESAHMPRLAGYTIASLMTLIRSADSHEIRDIAAQWTNVGA